LSDNHLWNNRNCSDKDIFFVSKKIIDKYNQSLNNLKMGVDYYVYTYLEIFYEDGESSYFEIDSKGHYYGYIEVDTSDSDSEGSRKRAEEENSRQKREEFAKYKSKKVLYEDGTWKISSQDKIKEYLEIINDHHNSKNLYEEIKYDFDDVKKVVKSTFAEER
jgi:hypothetical protein